MKILYGFFFLLLLGSAPAGCGREPGESAQDGRPRVVVLSPALGAIVRDLGAAERVVGRHAWDHGFDDGVPAVGDQVSIDYELLRRLNPTLVILQWGDRELPPRLVSIAQQRGWRIENFEVLTLDEITTATLRLGELLDRRPRAAELADDLDLALSPVDNGRENAGRTVALYGVSPLGVAGPGSFTYQLIERLGAEAVPATGPAFVQMDPEDLRRLDPDTIVFLTPGADEAEQRALASPLGRLQLRAVREGRVVFITDPGALLPSTTMIPTARELAAKLSALPAVTP